MIALVIPSNRPDNLRSFLDAWKPVKDWDITIAVHDGPEAIRVGADVDLCWGDIDKSPSCSAFSRCDSAIRSFGFLEAYRLGADVILSIDDDCLPHSLPLAAGHVKNLTSTPRWCDTAGERTRGKPYEALGTLGDVVISHGLWTGVPDYDAPTQLARGTQGNFVPTAGSQVIPRGQFFPMCGMNLAFKRQATPLMYFPLMGQGQPFSRFDDIWCGLIAKHVCDHLGWSVVNGEPFVHHSRASNVFINLVKESPGILENETAWKAIDEIKLTGRTAVECMAEIAEELTEKHGYWSTVGKAIHLWLELF